MGEDLNYLAQKIQANTKRIEKLELNNDALYDLSSSIKVMAKEMEYMRKSQDELNERITVIEERPKNRWDILVNASIVALVGVFIGFLLGGGAL